MTTVMPLCQVCGKRWSAAVAAIPGVAMSVAYCRECLDANAHPWWVLVPETAAIGGLERAADWWRQMVEDTCTHLGKDMAEFDEQVRASIEEFDNDAPADPR